MKEAVTKVIAPHTRGLPWGLPEVAGAVQQVHCSRRRLLRRGLEFHACTINKSATHEKSLETLNNPCISPQYIPTLLDTRLARFIAWHLRCLFLGECRWGPRHFLRMPGMFELRPCPRIHLKKPCAILVRLVERKANTNHLQAEWSVCTTLWEALGWDTFRSVFRCADLLECVLVPVAVSRSILERQEAIPSGSDPPRRG